MFDTRFHKKAPAPKKKATGKFSNGGLVTAGGPAAAPAAPSMPTAAAPASSGSSFTNPRMQALSARRANLNKYTTTSSIDKIKADRAAADELKHKQDMELEDAKFKTAQEMAKYNRFEQNDRGGGAGGGI